MTTKEDLPELTVHERFLLDTSCARRAAAEGRMPTHEEVLADAASGAREVQRKVGAHRAQLQIDQDMIEAHAVADSNTLELPRVPFTLPPSSEMAEASALAARMASPAIDVTGAFIAEIDDEIRRVLTTDEIKGALRPGSTLIHTLASGVTSPETPTEAIVQALLEDAVASSESFTPGAGERARDALNAFQALQEVNKKKRRRKLVRSILGWFVFFGLIAGIALACWKILPSYMFSGRYTVVADCKVPFGDGEITGKRTYSYAYRSLFGYHLVDESTVLERTEINVVGDKMIIFGLKGKDYWRQNIGSGERGIAILKPADMYFFFNDKNTAPPITHNAFCK